MESLVRWLFKQVDASFLAVFRMGFGAIMLFESINYGLFLCLDCLYHDTQYLFKYHHFEWVHPWSTLMLRVHWLLMAVAAACVMIGFQYRVAIIVFTLSFVYMFLLDQALYLNHFYMVILFCVLMIFMPANRYWAIDANRNPSTASNLVPNWSRFILGAQLEIILIYAGLVKLNSDWLNLEPMRLWMNYRSQKHGEFLQFLTQDWGIALASYGVIGLHLIGAPLLLWRKTRLIVLFCYAIFHIINAFVFNIGIFPWFTLFASLLFFDPHWPKQLWSFLTRYFRGLAHRFPVEVVRFEPEFMRHKVGFWHWTIAALIGVWLTVQIVMPVRHVLAPGNVAWNEDGHRFSWRMMLRAKSGNAIFTVASETGETWKVKPGDYLTPKQTRKMVCIPDMIWQFAQFLESEWQQLGYRRVEVTADIDCSLNARDPSRLVDNRIDLTSIPRDEPTINWILSLDKPLKNPLWSFVK